MLQSYHAPAIRPSTPQLVALQSEIDRLGTKISRALLVNCDTRNLQAAADEQDRLLDLVMSLSQRLGSEIAARRRDTAPSYKITTVGLMLLDPRPVLTPEERVQVASDEAKAEREATYRYAPAEDEHPIAVGSCDLAIPDRRTA